MLLDFFAFAQGLGQSFLALLPVFIGLGAVFAGLSFVCACNPGQRWWQKPDLATDLCYWFFIPLMTRYLRIGLLITGAALFFGIYSADALAEFYANGHGPLAQISLPVQVAIFLIASDCLLYWIHRGFHRPKLWKYHAVHHSSEQLDWISAARFHPINLFLGSVAVDVALLLAGIPPNVLVFVGPFTTAHSAFVHANLNWTLGPFKYVLASPVFHRWHHTAADRGGSKNFAATFPVLDVMFGTFYMPQHETPGDYGVSDPKFPEGFSEQILYPFR